MCTICAPDSPQAQLNRDISQDIKNDGCSVMLYQNPDETTRFGHTIGLSAKGHPELMIWEEDTTFVVKMLRNLAHGIVHHGQRFERDDITYWFGFALTFEEIVNVEEIAPIAMCRYGEGTRVLMVVPAEEQDGGYLELEDDDEPYDRRGR